MVALLVFIMAIHGYSGPDPNLEIRGGQSSRPFEKSWEGGWGGGVGGLQKPFFFSALRATAVLETVLVEKKKKLIFGS